MKYIIRFDDITSTMSWNKFLYIKEILQNFGIKSVLGVVPENNDPKLLVDPPREDFFDFVRTWLDFGDTIAQHGQSHVYCSRDSGLLGINRKSEFAGLPYRDQLEKLSLGKATLLQQNVWEPFFMAPAHSFDSNTLRALKTLKFKAITDGYGFFPYEVASIIFVPQMSSFPIRVGPGISTICLHVNTMKDRDVARLADFIMNKKTKFLDFKDVCGAFRGNSSWISIQQKACEISLRSFRKIKSCF